jgi:hypothetical protein
MSSRRLAFVIFVGIAVYILVILLLLEYILVVPT